MSEKERAPRDDERCRCGRAAVIVFISKNGEAPFCGGEKSPDHYQQRLAQGEVDRADEAARAERIPLPEDGQS